MNTAVNLAPASETTGNHATQLKKTNLKSNPQIFCAPPLKRSQKVRNPFESALTERLHLPLIGSPSLFQCCLRPSQLPSTQFEVDIEEVSQVKKTDVVPHETQFHESPDSELESKAQLAISEFFKESLILPSPVDCPLRKQCIILTETDKNTPISNRSNLLSKDCDVQTELSLPSVLPQALEEALRPYTQPHLAGNGVDNFNSSMRRKLFDLKNVIVLGEMEQGEQQEHVQMVGSSPQCKRTIFAGRLSDSSLEDSCHFGCLSPIRKMCATPDNGHSLSKCEQLLHDDMRDMPSPIAPSEHLLTESKASQFSPERNQSSPMALDNCIDSSINQLVKRLRVNCTPKLQTKEFDQAKELDSDGMQLSMHSSNGSSSNSVTPRGHRRLLTSNRKNLSRSFSTELSDDAEMMEPAHSSKIDFFRSDSGFNETSIASNFACSQEMPYASNYDCNSMDVSMISCATPSKKF